MNLKPIVFGIVIALAIVRSAAAHERNGTFQTILQKSISFEPIGFPACVV